MGWIWGSAYGAVRNRLEQVRDVERTEERKLLEAYIRGRKTSHREA